MKHPDPSWGRSELFLELSRYEAQLARWKAVFPPEQIKVLQSADLRLEETWWMLQEWLGLTPMDLLADEGAQNANTAGLSRFESLNRILTQTGLKRTLGAALPSGLKQWLLGWYYSDDAVPRMTEDEREALTALLAQAQS